MNNKSITLFAALALACGTAALAQPPSSRAIEEIIVSAQKRDESLNEVPASIAAFTSESMQSSGVTTTQALEWVVPGLVFTSFNGGSQPYVRGIGADNNTVASESPFAVYVDGVYRPAHYTGIQDLEDVERVEVLLGPPGHVVRPQFNGGRDEHHHPRSWP